LPPYPIASLQSFNCKEESAAKPNFKLPDAFYFVSAESTDTAITYR